MPGRLLVVDDEPRNVRVLTAILEASEYETVTASSGTEALEILGRESVDLMLLDLAMPTVDGIAVLREVRAKERADETRLPVILVTAHAARDARLAGMEAGADEFLEKPIDRALLLTRVASLLKLKHAQDQLAARHAALLTLQKEKERFTQFLVHDLKHPIGVVTANLDYVSQAQTIEDHESNEALADAREAAWRLASMVQDLLTIATIEEGHRELRITRFEVEDLFREVMRTYARNAEARNVSWLVPGDNKTEVSGDRALFLRVIENLVENALRFTPERGVVSFTTSVDEYVRISVGNTGRPIPVHIRDKIFESYFRQGDTAGYNAGLGLNFCRIVVHAHGGTIAVSDSETYGTLFTISLPRVDSASTSQTA